MRLGNVGDAEVGTTFRQTIEMAGGSIRQDALDACVDAIGGFPFMLQLVGYRAWAESGDGHAITLLEAERGVTGARRELEDQVLAATYRELSRGDLRFIGAMLADSIESRLSVVAGRMDVKSNYATKYKERLLVRGVIEERGRGVFAFALPMFRDYAAARLAGDGDGGVAG